MPILNMTKDSVDFVKKCLKCQQHAHFHVASAEELSTIMSLWLFNKWGIDLLGYLPLTLRQVKYLIVAIDYFTKWVEAEPLSTIGSPSSKVRLEEYFHSFRNTGFRGYE